VPAGEETTLVDRGREFAQEENVYLLMTAFVQPEKGMKELENVATFVEPDGTVAWRYQRTIITPGDSQIPGDGRIRTQDTPYGKIAAAVCFDLVRPSLIRQAGQAGADIVFLPSDDWQAIDPLHTWMASFRAIENGVSVIRPTGEGLSAAYDYQGRVLAATDYFTSGGGPMIVHVPTQGVRTIYSVVGDAFAWLCVAALAITLGAAFWRKRR
jgi:apolipoprotein N-acyltransferase